MKHIFLSLLFVAGSLFGQLLELPPPAAGKIDYEEHVQPILEAKCFGCHGPARQMAGLRLDSRQSALRGGDYGRVIVPGDSEGSKLIHLISGGKAGVQMPPSAPLEDYEISILRAWIDQGPDYGNSQSTQPAKPKRVSAAMTALLNAVAANQVLGLVWGGAEQAPIGKAASGLRQRQMADGGWAQVSRLSADAYATGQALYALALAGVPPADPAYQQGVDFLLRTQAADGTWHVRTRSKPFQPYFESGFPYGHDQWISAAGTSWGAAALSMAVTPPVTAAKR